MSRLRRMAAYSIAGRNKKQIVSMVFRIVKKKRKAAIENPEWNAAVDEMIRLRANQDYNRHIMKKFMEVR